MIQTILLVFFLICLVSTDSQLSLPPCNHHVIINIHISSFIRHVLSKKIFMGFDLYILQYTQCFSCGDDNMSCSLHVIL